MYGNYIIKKYTLSPVILDIQMKAALLKVSAPTEDSTAANQRWTEDSEQRGKYIYTELSYCSHIGHSWGEKFKIESSDFEYYS